MVKPLFRVIQITDTHLFANQDHELLGVNTQNSFKAVLDLLQQEQGQADFIIHSGDLSQDYSPESYQRLGDMLRHFNVPVYTVAGNHDDFNIMKQVYPYQNMLVDKNLVVGEWQFVFLNSQKHGAVEGFLPPSELVFLEHCLKKHPKHKTVIVFHHHPLSVQVAWLEPIGLRNKEEFWDLVSHYQNVNLVLFGHVHQEFSGMMNGIPCYSTPSTCIQFKGLSEQFTLEKIPPGYRWLEFYPHGKFETGLVRADHYIGEFDGKAKGY